MKTLNEEILNNTDKKIIYVGFNNSDYSKPNGFLAIDSMTRNIDLNLFETEKYRPTPLNLVPGTLKHVQISNSLDTLSDKETVIKLILGTDFKILYSECMNNDDTEIENILTSNLTEKISGIYPGTFKDYQKDITKISEANVFLLTSQAIQTLDNITKNDQITKEIKEQIIEWEYALDFCLAHLSRFGVEQQFNPKTKRMEKTNTFKAWYKWWYEYFQSITEDEELSVLLHIQQKTCQNLDMFRPNGSFESYLKEQSKTSEKRKIITKEKVS